MSKGNELLKSTQVERFELLMSKVKHLGSEFTDIKLNNTLCKVPMKNTIVNKNYYRSKISLPISYETTVKYRIRVDGTIHDLYKQNNNYYFIDHSNLSSSKELFREFRYTIHFTYILYIIKTLIEELNSQGLKVKIYDEVYGTLLDHLSVDENPDLHLYLSVFNNTEKKFEINRLYISIFN